MSVDFPDFKQWHAADIIAQTIAELTQRPKYGAAREVHAYKNALANNTVTIVSITGEGIIYGGVIYLDAVATQRYSLPKITIDGTSLGTLSWAELLQYGFSKTHGLLLQLTAYNNIAFVYGAGIKYGITFESSVEIKYTEYYGRTPVVHGILIYAVL